MADFHFAVRPKVWLGPDTLLRLPLLAGEFAGQAAPRALLVADPLLYESKTVDRVRSLLEDRGIQVLVFDEIPDRATSRTADDLLRIARGSRAPLVVSLGGIQTLMLARAVAVAAPSRLDIDSLLDGKTTGCEGLPLVEIPTSLRHGFMTSDCFVLTDGRDRRCRLVSAAGSAPAAVLIDPNLAAGLSPKIAAPCVLDGLMGAVEAYVSARSSFMSDLILEKAIASLAKALGSLLARPDDPSARADAWRGSFLAAVGQGMSAPGIGTALSLTINAHFPVPKSSLAAILLPYSLEAASKSRLEKVAGLLPLLGEESGAIPDSEAAAKTVEWLRTRLGLLKIPSRLKDFDLSLDRLVETARDARELDFMNYLPRAVSVDDVFDFVKTAF
ncbi:MAG: iron-containing alcohol dehydrogenase [Spirochaetaceae bacterium]|nr:iron-containing alcohol dehydrogenase [Spirochaetaceae bacterium]